MRTGGRGLLVALAAVGMVFFGGGCAKQSNSDNSCSVPPTERIAGSTGSALVFVPDPAMSAKDPSLQPTADLDPYRSRVPLANLTGKGVLQGTYVDVRSNQGSCQEQYGALSPTNEFEYPHRDSRFQEAMAYYFADSYQSALADAGVEVASDPIHVIAHCMNNDNAVYQIAVRGDGSIEEQVCLGDSVATPGASYADDAYVVVHELQHATTMRHYSLGQWLGEFRYDEAGALNEGISDFMALMFLSPLAPDGFDSRIFSPWALGKFVPGQKGFRGAHRCPIYDRSWPDCASFPEFSGAEGHVSYVYPDGLGWPYGEFTSTSGANALSLAFLNFPMQEEIHSNAIIVEGMLWEIYEGLLENHGDRAFTQKLVMKLMAKTIEDLPKPDSLNLSPVTFRELASSLIYVAGAMKLSSADRAVIRVAIQNRGLSADKQLDANWAAIGPGSVITPGLRIEDSSEMLQAWVKQRGGNPDWVHAATTNGQLDPGETAVVWFDVQDIASISAGGVTLTIRTENPNITFIQGANRGWVSNQEVQVQYAKINGTHIVDQVSQRTTGDGVFTGSSYFRTNPQYEYGPMSGMNLTTGVWLQVSDEARHGDVVQFEVEAKPSNGAASLVTFDATIH